MNHQEYYGDEAVQLELVKQLAYRELAIRKVGDDSQMFRCCAGYNKALLLGAFDMFRLFDKTTKLYHSVGTVERTPWVSGNPDKREAGRQEWQDQFDNHMTGYDFVVDIDSSDLREAHRVAQVIKGFLDMYKVPYVLNFSGTKGFHFRVAHKWLPDEPINARINHFVLLAEAFRKITNTTENRVIDSIYDRRRLIKLPYSIDGSSGKVVLPLSDKQFEGFFEEDLSPEAVLPSIRFRGLLERQGSPKGFSKMYEVLVNG
jgi:hypothetical protein